MGSWNKSLSEQGVGRTLMSTLSRSNLVACSLAVTCITSCDFGPSATSATSKSWQSRLPISMNGEAPEHLPSTWADHRWHDCFYGRGTLEFSTICNWKAAEFFDDSTVAELCDAIFDEDIGAMRRLISAGADVNAIGKQGVTPLYWAFHMETNPEPFELLLKHGADPNVIAHMDGETWTTKVLPGNAVVHLVCQGTYNRLFKRVFESGGDPNLPCEAIFSDAKTPLNQLYSGCPDVTERLELLIAQGANLDYRDDSGHTFVSRLVAGCYERQYKLALIALENGADYRLTYNRGGHQHRLIHFLAACKVDREREERAQYDALVSWLEERGESLDAAKEDLRRWTDAGDTSSSGSSSIEDPSD